ncbi:MAG: hypothetical protein JJU06_00525 [Ectothiorhodospiraceae bacterium]|nr:hypothetical protein [Ectothiorhodospiraceae bacterium]MCH8504248.1 hypothetical protein [Ectothiorhodospiraceae bacterium]
MPPTDSQTLSSLRSLLAYLTLLVGMFGTGHLPAAIGAPAVLLAIALGWSDLRFIARLLLSTVAFSAVIALMYAPSALVEAAANMARLAALVVAVMLLSAMLGRSRDLHQISAALFTGSATSRYGRIAAGTGFLGVPLNFGAVSVVGTLLQREMQQHGDTPLSRNATRAILRGFGATPFCSPLSLSVVITLTFVPGLVGWQLIALSLPVAVSYVVVGLLFREPEPPLPSRPGGNAARGPMLRFAACIAAICIGAFALSDWSGMSYAKAVTISCAAMVAGGLLLQALRGAAAPLPAMGSIGNELAIMGGSAFLGALASTLALHLLGVGFDFPGWAYPGIAFLVPWLMFLGGMAGFNPIVIGTLLGGVLGPIWPPAAVLGLGLAMVSGWGLTVAGTPYSANSLLIERLTGYDARMIAVRWNLPLSALALTVIGLLAATITYALT